MLLLSVCCCSYCSAACKAKRTQPQGARRLFLSWLSWLSSWVPSKKAAAIVTAIVTAAASPMVLVPEPGLSAVAAAAPETVSKAEAVGASLRNLLLPLLVASRKQRPTSPASKPSLLSSQQQLRVFCQS